MKIDKKYQTGVYWQDVQHGQLIELYNKLLSRREMNSAASMFSYSLGFLVMYADQHFKLEEAYMQKYKYPDMDTHIRHHQAFIKDLKAFKRDYTVYSDQACQALKTTIGKWIKNHILENDQKLGAFLIRCRKEKLGKSLRK